MGKSEKGEKQCKVSFELLVDAKGWNCLNSAAFCLVLYVSFHSLTEELTFPLWPRTTPLPRSSRSSALRTLDLDLPWFIWSHPALTDLLYNQFSFHFSSQLHHLKKNFSSFYFCAFLYMFDYAFFNLFTWYVLHSLCFFKTQNFISCVFHCNLPISFFVFN